MDPSIKQKTTNQRILNTTAIVGSVTALVYFLNAIKDLVAASYFGTTDAMDAFILAFLLPSFCINVFAGSIPSSLIPTMTQVRNKDGKESSLRLLANVNIYGSLLLFLVTIFLILTGFLSLSFLGIDFSPEKLELTKSIFYCLLPLILLQGLCSIWGASLNIFDEFALVALFPILPSLLTLAFFVLMPDSRITIYLLVWGAVLGTTIQLCLLIYKAYSLKILVMPRSHPALKEVTKQYWPVMAGALLTAGNTVIDQAMAARLPSGNLAAMNYGDRIVTAILGISSVAIGTAVLPYFSRLTATKQWTELAHTFKKNISLIWKTTVPLTIFILLFSEPIVFLLWERGAFTSQDTLLVSQIQICYALRIPFYLTSIVMVRLISSFRANQFLFFISISNLVMNFVFNLIFVQWWGVVGLALSTSVVYAISFLMLHRATKLCWTQSHAK